MEESQENFEESLVAAAAAAAVESEVRGSDSETQKGVIREEHDGLLKGSVSETQKGDMKEEHDGFVVGSDRKDFEGSDGKDGQMNGEIDSSDVPVVDVTKNVLQTEVVLVEENEEGLDMNGLKGGKEAEKENDSSDDHVVETEIVSAEEKREIVQDIDVFEGVKKAEKGCKEAEKENYSSDGHVVETEIVSAEEKREIVQDIDVFEGVKKAEKDGKEAEKENDSSDGHFVETEIVSAEEKLEIVQDIDVFEGVKKAEKGIVNDDVPAVVTENFTESEVVLVEEKEEIEDIDGLEVVKEPENETEFSLGVDNLEKNVVQENRVQKVGESAMNVNDEKSENSDEEDVGENDHEFAVGDFVWGKIKSYPWWPGQIYDPSDASKYAEKRIVKGCLLVAYFGDDSFSWCRKSQLKRFAENFYEMSRQNNSKNFLHAVAEALDGFSRAVEMEMSSLYLPLENHIWDFKARNRGIKAGVIVPRGDYLKLFLTRLEPETLLGNLRHAAKTGFAVSPLELRVLRSWLTGFYHRKGSYSLAEFHEPIPIEGMEDKMGNVAFVPIQGPADEDWTAIQTTSEDKVYRRKWKSAMEEDMVGIELMHGRESVNELKFDKKKMKRDFGSENGGSVKKLPGKRGRKRKSETETRSPESVQNGDLEKGETDGKEEMLKSFASRERKKSKYLSPPYTTPEVITSKMGERMTRVAGQLIGSTKILSSCSSQSNKKRSKQVDDDIDVKEVLSVITDAAVDPMNTSGMENLDQITEFVSAFQSSVSSDGSKESAGKDCRKAKFKDKEVSLLITFPPSFTLPKQANLFEIFGKFGEIKETETDVYANSFSAQVGFVRKSDAEEAYRECLKNSFFGEGNINYRLLSYPSRKASYADKKTAKREFMGLGLITKKLEKLTWEVKNLDGQVTAEMKRKLEGELKDLAAEVSNLPESLSSP